MINCQHINYKDVLSLLALPIHDKLQHVTPYLVEKSGEGPAAVHSCVVHSSCCSTKGGKESQYIVESNIVPPKLSKT